MTSSFGKNGSKEEPCLKNWIFKLLFVDKAAEVVHKVKHYGAFGEDYLGYSDPTKDLRKAVKKKEKAAKKAKKANKKKTGKKEDLFDPENLEKYKREIEQRRLEKEAALSKALEVGGSDEEVWINEKTKPYRFCIPGFPHFL